MANNIYFTTLKAQEWEYSHFDYVAERLYAALMSAGWFVLIWGLLSCMRLVWRGFRILGKLNLMLYMGFLLSLIALSQPIAFNAVRRECDIKRNKKMVRLIMMTEIVSSWLRGALLPAGDESANYSLNRNGFSIVTMELGKHPDETRQEHSIINGIKYKWYS